MKIYHYHPKTKAFLTEEEADIDPIDKNPLIPAHATKIKPLAATKNKVAVFNGTKWQLKNDYRGYKGFDQTGQAVEITEIDTAIDPSWTIKKPFILSDEKNKNKEKIRTDFAASLLDTVKVDGILYHAGYESALKLDGAKRLVEKIPGETTVLYYDTDNQEHELTFEQADAVIIAVGLDYQIKFGKKQKLLVDIDALPAAANQAAVDKIKW